MQRDAVTSSVIRSIGYDEPMRALEVEFRTGRVYQYFDVPATLYAELLVAPSIGEFFNHEVRDRFATVEVTDNE